MTYGGWMEMGYHSQNTGLSRVDGDLLDTNDVPGNLNLQQSWLYMEKLAKAEGCCCRLGLPVRHDLRHRRSKDPSVRQLRRGSANGPQGWDNGWDNGIYGWAMPQAYLQFATGDWS